MFQNRICRISNRLPSRTIEGIENGRNLYIYCPYVILNKTGLPLVYQQRGRFRKKRPIPGDGKQEVMLEYSTNGALNLDLVNPSIDWKRGSNSTTMVMPFLLNFPKHQPTAKNKLRIKTTNSNWSEVSSGHVTEDHELR